MVAKVAETKLLHQALREALLDGEGVVLRALVFAVVVDVELVGWRRIVFIELGQGHLARGVVRIVVLGFGRGVVQDRVFLQFLADYLFKLLDRLLDQLDGLDLKGRELLLLFEA